MVPCAVEWRVIFTTSSSKPSWNQWRKGNKIDSMSYMTFGLTKCVTAAPASFSWSGGQNGKVKTRQGANVDNPITDLLWIQYFAGTKDGWRNSSFPSWTWERNAPGSSLFHGPIVNSCPDCHCSMVLHQGGLWPMSSDNQTVTFTMNALEEGWGMCRLKQDPGSCTRTSPFSPSRSATNWLLAR